MDLFIIHDLTHLLLALSQRWETCLDLVKWKEDISRSRGNLKSYNIYLIWLLGSV